MRKNDIEKSLKRFLKRRVSYSFSLLIAFMITGGIALGAGITAEEIYETKRDLLIKIQEEREAIKQKLLENQSKMKTLNLDSRILLKEADFYSKPTAPAYGFSMIGGFKKADSVSKDWKGSVRGDTSMDKLRKRFNEVHGTSAETGEKGTLLGAAQYTHNNKASGYASSGWINMSGNYHSNTNVYDAEAKLFILPVVKAPVVIEPTVPNVAFTVPTAPTVIPVTSPAIASITVGAVNVTAPTVVTPTVSLPTTPTAPGDIIVTVNEPNINVNIGAINVAGPGVLNIPTLSTPVLNISVPINLPPRVEDPNPVVTTPDSPAAPNFEVYVRKRGNWLYGVSANGTTSGFNNFDRRIKRWVGINNTNTSINDAPFFNISNTIYGNGSTSEIVATTAPDGTVTNEYRNIATNVGIGSAVPTNAWFSPGTVSVSPYGFPVINANQYYSYVDNGSLGVPAAGDTNNLYLNKFQQIWIFQGAPALVRDMNITVGGEKSKHGTAIFAQTTGVRMQNVNINLKGKTIIADVESQYDYIVNFNNVNIDIAGNYNTILALGSVTPNQHRYTSSIDCRPDTLEWGVYRGDKSSNNTGINLGVTNIKAETSNNAIFYLLPASVHRWTGSDSVVSTPPSLPAATYHTNPGRYQMYYPSPGNIKFQNAGTVEFVGSGNAGAWLASYVPDRTKLSGVTGASGSQIVDLGTINLSGDNNVGYYFADNKTNPAGNAVFQGKVVVKANLGITLDGTSGGTTQKGTGNDGSNSNVKSDKNVALYIASGQRTDMNTLKNGFAQYFPATLSFTIDNVNAYGDKIAGKIGTETGRYTGMGNLIVNLAGHGVNLGVFRNIDVTWDGSATYVNGLKTIPKVAAINTGAYWYKSSLDGGKISIQTNVNRDNISTGVTSGDGFNDIIMERKEVVLKFGYNITSANGNSLLLGSNSTAALNTESGYTIEGIVDISNTPGSSTTAAYTSFGYINVDSLGKLKVSEGIGAYGVNGSKVINNEIIEVANSNSTNSGIGIAVLATNASGTPDTYGKNAGKAGLWGEVINKGTIGITGTHGIGIYMENNHNSAAKSQMTMHNEAPITLGDDGKGIVIRSTNTTGAGGTLTLKDSGSGRDIKVGKNGVGIYAQGSDVKMNGNYGIEIQEGGVALQSEGNTIISHTNAADKLTVDYAGTSGAGNTAIGIAFKGTTGNTFNNNMNMEVLNTSGAETIVGIYGTGAGTLTNSGDITAKSTGSYGIISEGVNVVNTGVVTVGDSLAPVSGAIGIYAKDASVDTVGKDIVIEGNGDSSTSVHPIGIYAKSSIAGNREIKVTNGSAPMSVAGKAGIGIYVEDTIGTALRLNNSSNITLGDSLSTADRRFGIFMTNTKNTLNETSGIVNVGKNNIGIYSKDSILKNGGTINVVHNEAGTENIGVHNVTDNGNFTFSNSGTINVNGVSNIGISAKTTGAHQGMIELNGGTIVVTAASLADGNIPLGIYASGNNITVSSIAASSITAAPNAVGIYMDGDNTSKTSGLMNISLSSDTGGKMGIGAYYKGGAFADTGTMKLSSTSTALSGSDPVRPIGLYYGTGSAQNKTDIEIVSGSDEIIGMYGSTLAPFTNSGNITLDAKGIGAYFIDTDVANSGNVTVNIADGYGMYFKGGDSSSTGTITSTGNNSVGVIVTKAGSSFTNSIGGTINSGGSSSIGVYAENGATFTNAGTLNSTLAGGSIGAFAKGSTIENTGTIGSHYLGLYGKDASTINYTSGTLTVNSGVGILADGGSSVVNLNGGTITGTANNTTSVVGKNTGIVNLNGTNISQTGSGTVGIVLDSGSSTLTSGNISVGTGGTGVYAENSSVNLAGYSGTIAMGNQGIAMYSKDSALSSGTLNVNYTNTAKGVGIYYAGTNPVTNNITVNHTGDNLVSIFADGISLTNTAAQTINTDGIGIYGDNGAAVSNQGTLALSGDDTIGIYLDGASSTVTNMGTITGAPSTVGNKIGVYVNSGDITGNTAYNFDIDGGIGIYLKNNAVSYTGTMTVTGDSTAANRTIGIYVDPSITGTLGAKINVTGEDALGIYLAENLGVAANITYNGELNITSSSTANKGIGALLEQGSTFTLGAGGKVDIGGTNNMGFYVKNGANLNVAGGTVTNTAAGIFAYLDNGNLHFTSGTPVNINFANVIVSGALGNILNDTAITVGTSGLQGDSGATITNSNLGTINGNVINAKAMVGTGVGTTLTNAGTINLTGNTSIGMYTENFAVGTSTGHVSVGDKSAAYYVGADGTMNISGTASVGEDSTLLFGAGGTINYTGTDIVMSNKSIALTLSDSASLVDFNNREVTTGTEGTGIFLTGTGDISKVTNLDKLNVSNKSTGIFMDNNVALNTGIKIDLTGTEAIGIFTTNNGNINYSGNIDSSTVKNKGIINTGTGTTVNSGTMKLMGDSSIGMYSENGTMINNSSIEVGNGAYTGLILNSAVAMYGKNVTSVSNTGNIEIGKDAVGIFGENTVVTNSNFIQSTGAKSTGIYGLQGSASNTGSIVLGDSSNGIFVKNGTLITNTGNITVGNTNSAGIYGAGTTSVNHNSGTITAGKESVGIATENGNITVANGAVINVGTDSSYIYSASGTGTNNTNLSLSDHSIGMYTKSGTMINNANITVGKSTVVSGLPPKISVGMAAESGTVENSTSGYIYVPDDHGVGMVANDGGHGINRGTIQGRWKTCLWNAGN